MKILTPVTEKTEIIYLPVSGALNAHRTPSGTRGLWKPVSGPARARSPTHAASYSLGWEQRPRADAAKVLLVVDESSRGEIISLTWATIIATPASLWHTWRQMSDGPSVVLCAPSSLILGTQLSLITSRVGQHVLKPQQEDDVTDFQFS